MTTKEIKLMIIQNFIEYYTTDEDERMDMIGLAQTYVDEDWVDEIAQAGYEHISNHTDDIDPFDTHQRFGG